MSDASTSGGMSLQRLEGVERARREPKGRFHSLAHRIDVSALERAYPRIRKDAAVGVDGVTKEEYGQDLEANLQDLHARMKAKRPLITRAAINPSDVSTSQRKGERRGRLESRRSRTKLSKTPCARCWRRSTSRTSWTARTAFDPDAVPMMLFEPSTESYTGAR